MLQVDKDVAQENNGSSTSEAKISPEGDAAMFPASTLHDSLATMLSWHKFRDQQLQFDVMHRVVDSAKQLIVSSSGRCDRETTIRAAPTSSDIEVSDVFTAEEALSFLRRANGDELNFDAQAESLTDYREKIARHTQRPAAIPLSLIAGSGMMNAASVEYALEHLYECYEAATGIQEIARYGSSSQSNTITVSGDTAAAAEAAPATAAAEIPSTSVPGPEATQPPVTV